jgi:glycosyltransferase involved in cell wall biosynthesis
MLNEFGGAERVLLALTEIYPDAPIYTSYLTKNSPAYHRFRHKKIITSWINYFPFIDKISSPLRPLIPLIWGSFYFSKKDFDIIISSSSWYVTKGFRRDPSVKELCYCHTPPRWLYGLPTSVNFQKYYPIRFFTLITEHFIRIYDFARAQKVDKFIANSQNTLNRIKKFYRRDSVVVYPPVDLPLSTSFSKKDFYLIVSRLAGAKGLDLAVKTANKLNLKLKIIGTSAGLSIEHREIKKISGKNIEFLGYVPDDKLVELYSEARAFLALATDEDFGITPVESMACGTPVIAYAGGGYLETVIDSQTGIFFHDATIDSLSSAIKKFESLKFKKEDCVIQDQKFSKENFIKNIKKQILAL